MNPHLRAPLVHFGDPAASGRVAVILLHGRNQTPAVMERDVVQRLDLRGLAYLAPSAADDTWYPASFMAPFADNEPRLSQALERVEEISVDLARRGVPAELQVILGFSQGACLGCQFVYRARRRFGALIAFTGGLLGPPGTSFPPLAGAFSGMPALFGGAADDPWVPASRMRESAETFALSGANVETAFYDGNVHEVRDAEIARGRAILERLRSPSQ
jgi:phospholipase/carboxylesterase